MVLPGSRSDPEVPGRQLLRLHRLLQDLPKSTTRDRGLQASHVDILCPSEPCVVRDGGGRQRTLHVLTLTVSSLHRGRFPVFYPGLGHGRRGPPTPVTYSARCPPTSPSDPPRRPIPRSPWSVRVTGTYGPVGMPTSTVSSRRISYPVGRKSGTPGLPTGPRTPRDPR